jgi:predicted nucleic acid-binding protein
LNRIYIDTNFLIDAVTGRDEEKSIQQSELDRIMNSSMQVHIPQIILGESFAIVARDSSSNDLKDNISTLVKLIQKLVPESNMKVCMPPINQVIIDKAREVKGRDNRPDWEQMDWTDAIFISHAFLDRDARTVFTTDGRIQDSDLVSTMNEERKNKSWSELSVRDSVEKKKRLKRRRGY